MWLKLTNSILRIGRVLGVVYLGVLLLLMFFERSLIFFPMKHPEGYWTKPSSEWEDANFSAADGTKLHGWYAPVANPSAVILVAHGNAGNLTHRVDLMQSLNTEVGATVFVFDYRGYGRSEGQPDEAGILQDARAARAWLAMKAGVAEKDIILMGESLGTGVVVDLAVKDGARGIILQSAFTSLPAVAAQIYPWMPVRWLMRTRLDSLSKIGEYPGPVLQFHGDEDEIIPFELGQELFAAVPNPAKRWHTLSGSMHNSETPPEFFTIIRSWVESLPPLEKGQTSGSGKD